MQKPILTIIFESLLLLFKVDALLLCWVKGEEGRQIKSLLGDRIRRAVFLHRQSFVKIFCIKVIANIFFLFHYLSSGVVTNPMVQQPVMSGGLEVVSPITFPEDHEDPVVAQENMSGGGIWGFIKVKGNRKNKPCYFFLLLF